MMSVPTFVFVAVMTLVLVCITFVMWYIWLEGKMTEKSDRIKFGNNGETWFFGIINTVTLYGVCLIFSYFSMLPKMTFSFTIGG